MAGSGVASGSVASGAAVDGGIAGYDIADICVDFGDIYGSVAIEGISVVGIAASGVDIGGIGNDGPAFGSVAGGSGILGVFY